MSTENILDLLKESIYYKDGHLFWKIQGNNQFVYPGAKIGAVDSSGYMRFVFHGKRYLVHRIVFLLHYGYLPKYVDHINRDNLDNRIENLREASAQENSFNRTGKKAKTLPKGIFQRPSGSYYVALRLDGVLKRYGSYKSLEEAVIRVNQLHDIYHGEFKYQ